MYVYIYIYMRYGHMEPEESACQGLGLGISWDCGVTVLSSATSEQPLNRMWAWVVVSIWVPFRSLLIRAPYYLGETYRNPNLENCQY